MEEYNYNLETRIEKFYQTIRKEMNEQSIPPGIAWLILENLSKEYHSYHNTVVEEDLQYAKFYYEEQKKNEEEKVEEEIINE